MLSRMRSSLLITALVVVASPVAAQQPPPPPVPPTTAPPAKPVQLPPPPARTVVAATVNGEKIPEIAVYRAMVRVPPKFWNKAKPEIMSFLIENTLVDQYLERIKIPVADADVAKKLDQIKEELKKEKQTLDDLLKKLYLTEPELREQIVGALRWEHFVSKYAPEKKLEELFQKNKIMFDGSLVRAKHLLIKPTAKSPDAVKQAKAKIDALKQQIETAAVAEMNKVSTNGDKLAAEKARRAALDKVFSEIATKESDCPSKKQGGELGWFPRLGKMVEPFAVAAFSQQPYQVSAPVKTEFGYHLIMPTERKAGRDVKYEQVKMFVKEVYAERMREAILQQMRPISKIQTFDNSKAQN